MVKVNCVWLIKEKNEISSENSAVLRLKIVYLKDATANMVLTMKTATLERDTEVFGKMDPFVECIVGTAVSSTEIKDNAGKAPVWN